MMLCNNKMKSQMEDVVSDNLLRNIVHVPKKKLLSLEDEDNEFLSQFNRVIKNNQSIKDIQDLQSSEFGEVDN